MNKERDLLPWILGTLSAAAIAVAFAAVSTRATAPALLPRGVAAQGTGSPTPPPAPKTGQDHAQAVERAVPQAAQPGSAPTSAPPQTQTAVEPQVRTGQIWECSTQGVKTFSNNPCGDKSTLLDVGPINTMNPTPAIHYPRGYGPEQRYATGYADQSADADADEDSDSYSAEAGGNSYTIIQGVGFVARRRPEHSHKPPPHHHAAPMLHY